MIAGKTLHPLLPLLGVMPILFSAGTVGFAIDDVAAATSEQADEDSVSIREIRAGVWLHTSHYTFPNGAHVPSNGLIVRSGDGLVLIDTAWGEVATIELLRLIERDIDLPVRRAIITHSHYDRSAGADVLERRGVEVLAHPAMAGLAIQSGTPVPDRKLTGLDEPGDATGLGTVEVFYPGPAHSPDNLMVWLPAQHVLFGGCAVRAADADSLGYKVDADLASWKAAIRRAQARYGEAEIVVPGHGDIGDSRLLSHTLSLLGN